MLADRSHERVHPGIVCEAGIVRHAPDAPGDVGHAVEIVEEAGHAIPEFLAVAHELQDLRQRAGSDQINFRRFGVHRPESRSWL
jgi:hypothetical protein